MNRKKYLLILLVLLTLILSACSSAPQAVWPGVFATDKTVYLVDGLQLYAVNLADGKDAAVTSGSTSTFLRFPAKQDSKQSFYAAPALTSDNQLIIGSAGANYALYSLNPDTLAINWTFSQATDSFIGGVLVANDTIYAPNADGKLYALDLKGNLKWTFEKPTQGLWSTPVTDGKLVFVASLDHHLYALDALTGAEAWDQKLDGASMSSPALGADGSLYIGTVNKSMYAFKSATGEQIWKQSMEGLVWASPVVNADTVYVSLVIGETQGKLLALNAADGKTKWPFIADGSLVGGPLVDGDLIIVASETGTVYALNNAGQQQWFYTVDKKIYTAPYAAGKFILISTVEAENLIYALNQSGGLVWQYKPQK